MQIFHYTQLTQLDFAYENVPPCSNLLENPKLQLLISNLNEGILLTRNYKLALIPTPASTSLTK